MAISKDEVKYIAQLAKLHFDEDEAEKFAKEFESQRFCEPQRQLLYASGRRAAVHL